MFWACRVPCLGAEWRMLVTVIPLRPRVPGALLGGGGVVRSRAESRCEHPAAAQGGWFAARRLKQALPLLKPFSFRFSRFSPFGDPDGRPQQPAAQKPWPPSLLTLPTPIPPTMESCPISLQETDTPCRSNSTHSQSHDPRSDSVLDKQPKPAGKHSPQDGQWSPGAPTQRVGVPPTLGVLDPGLGWTMTGLHKYVSCLVSVFA